MEAAWAAIAEIHLYICIKLDICKTKYAAMMLVHNLCDALRHSPDSVCNGASRLRTAFSSVPAFFPRQLNMSSLSVGLM